MHRPTLELKDYHLFLALLNFLSDKKLPSRENGQKRLLGVIAYKNQNIYESGVL